MQSVWMNVAWGSEHSVYVNVFASTESQVKKKEKKREYNSSKCMSNVNIVHAFQIRVHYRHLLTPQCIQ